MAYDIVTFPGAIAGPEMSCKDQHAAYTKEHARVSALAAELGPVAANCHKLHGDFESATAAASVQRQKNEQCLQSHTEWQRSKVAYDNYVAQKKACKNLASAISDHAALVKKIKVENAATKAAWEKRVAELSGKNYSLAQHYYAAQRHHKQQLDAWNARNAKYQTYLAAKSAMARGYAYGFAMKMTGPNATQGRKDLYAKYNWAYRTLHCGAPTMCMTQQKKRDLTNQCVVVRGLGSTKPNAPICTTRTYYATCGDTSQCPPWAPGPGAKPVEPKKPNYHTIPKEPTYKTVPTLDLYLAKKKVPKVAPCPPKKVPNPGTKPGCNPTAAIPPVPPRPTCTPPQIPALPVKPTCEPSMFGQVGPMWLLLAAGAGGLYWYSKKK